MKEAYKEADRIVNMFLNVKSNKINDYSKIEYPTAKECAILHVNGVIKTLSKIQESKDLSIESVRCVTKEIKLKIEVKTILENT